MCIFGGKSGGGKSKRSSKDSSAQEIKINKYDAPPKDPKMHYVMKGKDDAIPDESLTQVSVTPSQVKKMTTQIDDDAPTKKHGKHAKGGGEGGAVPVRRDMAHSHVNKGHAKSFKGKPTQSQSGVARKMVEHPEINQTPKGSKPSSKPATPSPSGTKPGTSVKEDIDKTKVKMSEVKKDMKDAGVKSKPK